MKTYQRGIQCQRKTWYQRMAALMVMVLLANLLFCNGQTVFAKEMEEAAVRQVCETGEYRIETVVTKEWDQGYNGEIILTNLSGEVMGDWQIQAECGDVIVSVWNGILTESEDGYCICGMEYNRGIPAGGSATVGYTASGSSRDLRVMEVSCLESEVQDGEDFPAAPEGITCEKEGYTVELRIAESWEKGYNAEVVITNTSTETIHNWGILLETKDRIRDLYNAQEAGNVEGRYLMRNSGYNQDIPSGESVRFGYTAEYDASADIPAEYVVSSIEREVICEDYKVSSFVGNVWEGGAVAEILIENRSESAIEDWILEFDADVIIEEVWNAQVVSHVGEHYIFRNASYAQNIIAGETAVAGMRLSVLPAGCEEGELLRNIVVREILPGDESGFNTGTGDPSVSENNVSGNNVSDNNVSDNNISDNIVSNNGFPGDDIVRLEAGGNAGEIYYKVAYESDVVMAPDGLPCIKNQFLLAVDESVSFPETQAYLDRMGAWIVGYIEATGDYQVEMKEETDVESVQELIGELRNEPWIVYVGFNYVWLEESCFHTKDPWSETGNTAEGELNTASPGGHNWGLELIDFEGALRNAGVIYSSQTTPEEIRTNHLTTVRMGLIDSAFDEWHEDLSCNFVRTWQNFRSQNELLTSNYNNDYNYYCNVLIHGTHVAGVMCAGFNNGVGINGVCVKNELYGFAVSTPYVWEAGKQLEGLVATTFFEGCGLTVLITNDIKVINYSRGVKNDIAYAASVDTGEGRRRAIQYLDVQSAYMERILDKFIKEGYDFLIVVSAGNANNKEFYSCKAEGSYICGYIDKVQAEKMGDDEALQYEINKEITYCAAGRVEARYNSPLTYISETSPCYDHIICAGAVEQTQDGSYQITSYSNVGNRVDVYAPGEYIYSTCATGIAFQNKAAAPEDCNYTCLGGTSVAAPYVSGAAGLAYNVNPDLKAVEIKDSITLNANIISGNRILNVANVIADIVSDMQEEYTVKIHVVDFEGNALSGSKVEIRNVTGYPVIVLGAVISVVPVPDSTVVCSGVVTDEQGMARINLPQGSYFAVVDGGEGGVCIKISVGEESEETAVYEAVMESYDVAKGNHVTLQFNNFTIEQLSAAEVRFRSGWNQRNGEYVSNASGDSVFLVGYYRTAGTVLPGGAYTVEITGCYAEPVYYNVVVCPSGDIYAIMAE